MISRTRKSRAALLAGALLAFGSAIALAGLGSDVRSSNRSESVGASPRRPTGEKLATLRAVARRIAAANGEPHPTNAVVFSTNGNGAGYGDLGRDDAAVRLDEPDQSVYYIVMRGHFTSIDGVGPPRSPQPPPARVLTITIDASTLRVEGIAFLEYPREAFPDYPADSHIFEAPDTSRLGTPTPLELESSG